MHVWWKRCGSECQAVSCNAGVCFPTFRNPLGAHGAIARRSRRLSGDPNNAVTSRVDPEHAMHQRPVQGDHLHDVDRSWQGLHAQ